MLHDDEFFIRVTYNTLLTMLSVTGAYLLTGVSRADVGTVRIGGYPADGLFLPTSALDFRYPVSIGPISCDLTGVGINYEQKKLVTVTAGIIINGPVRGWVWHNRLADGSRDVIVRIISPKS